jgi:hypothetical protein
MSLNFWLGVGAAQKSAKSKGHKSTERGHRVASIVVGILLTILLIAALLFLFLLSQS